MSDIIRIDAIDVRPGDELLVGPQGRVPDAPTVLSILDSEGVIVARLIDETVGESEARWLPDSRVTVLRRAA